LFDGRPRHPVMTSTTSSYLFSLPKAKGTSIDLSPVRRIVAAHRGTSLCDLGGGACIKILLQPPKKAQPRNIWLVRLGKFGRGG